MIRVTHAEFDIADDSYRLTLECGHVAIVPGIGLREAPINMDRCIVCGAIAENVRTQNRASVASGSAKTEEPWL